MANNAKQPVRCPAWFIAAPPMAGLVWLVSTWWLGFIALFVFFIFGVIEGSRRRKSLAD